MCAIKHTEVNILNNKLRVASYCRVSTDKEEQLHSLESQKAYFNDYISKHDDWVLQDVYFDEGISGTSLKNRDGFNKMIDSALRGEIDLILTKEVSRFARNTVDTLTITRQLSDVKVGVIFTNDGIDTRAKDGELRLTIMASLAQEESRKTSDRVKWGQTRMMEKGFVFGRNNMLGYNISNGKMTVDPNTKDIVIRIFNEYVYSDKGTNEIANGLIRDKITTKQGTYLWDATKIARILRNEKYVGDLTQKKTYTENYLTHKKCTNYDKKSQIFLTDHHEAIIDRNTWNLAQDKLNNRSYHRKITNNQTNNPHSNRYWCSGKIICSKCGNTYVSRRQTNKNGTILQSWKCKTIAKAGTLDRNGNVILNCKNGNINDRTLKTCVTNAFDLLCDSKDKIVDEIMGEIRQVFKCNIADTIRLERQIEQNKLKKQQLLDLLMDNIITKEEYMHQRQKYDNQIAKVTANIENIKAENTKKEKTAINLTEYVDDIRRILSSTTQYDDDFFESIVEKIIVKTTSMASGEVDIFFFGVPVGVNVKYENSGKGRTFKTNIKSLNVLSEKE